MDAIIESGAGMNITSRKVFKAPNFKAELKPCRLAIYTYGLMMAMQICGYFNAQVFGAKSGKCGDAEIFQVDVCSDFT